MGRASPRGRVASEEEGPWGARAEDVCGSGFGDSVLGSFSRASVRLTAAAWQTAGYT